MTTSVKRAQKFHTDDASPPRSGQCFRRGGFAALRLRRRPGPDGCQSALWDCFEGRIFNREITKCLKVCLGVYIKSNPNCLNKCYVFHDREVWRFYWNFSARKITLFCIPSYLSGKAKRKAIPGEFVSRLAAGKTHLSFSFYWPVCVWEKWLSWC